jgi:hypothetical protein
MSRTDRSLIFRTGTALRAARWLPAIVMSVLATVTGLPRQVARAGTAERIADYAGPGAIGVQRGTQRGPRPENPLPPSMQPVEVRGPDGLLVSIETAEGWSPLEAAPLRMGLSIGPAYRLRIGGIPGRVGEELFPSLRLLAKLDTPPGMAWRFPVEVVLDEDDLRTALDGGHVRRVVYVACEPDRADICPGGWFDVRPGDDPLAVAHTLGDPIAEIVLGNRTPSADGVP